MQEKTIPKGSMTGLMSPKIKKIIEDNGGTVGPTETVLRNIQEERPYLNTGAMKVFFKSGEYILYNERGFWIDKDETYCSD
jgi:hypothetical protein